MKRWINLIALAAFYLFVAFILWVVAALVLGPVQ